MIGYLVVEKNKNGCYKPLKVFKSINKALDFTEVKQKESNEKGLGLDYRYVTIENLEKFMEELI